MSCVGIEVGKVIKNVSCAFSLYRRVFVIYNIFDGQILSTKALKKTPFLSDWHVVLM